MGCVSSSFLEEDGSVAGGSSGFGHHIVSLTSTTYGVLTTFDNPTPPPSGPHHSCIPPPPPPPPSFSGVSGRRSPDPEIINSWELMEGLDLPTITHPPKSNPDITSFRFQTDQLWKPEIKREIFGDFTLDKFEERCPPGGNDSVVIYTTTLRGIRKTFEDCNTVRALIEGTGVCVKERDVSMDMGFREELRELMKGMISDRCSVPRVFVKGRYIGGVDDVIKLHDEGELVKILDGLPRVRSVGEPCDGCGGARFLPCFRCYGGRKLVMVVIVAGKEMGMVVRCPECNENGLVLCPICC